MVPHCQVKILPISDKHIDYAKSVVADLTAKGFRCELDTRDEKIGYKIREAQLEKVPHMLIVGQKEEDEKTVSVRKRDEGDIGSMTLDQFAAQAE